MMSEEQTKYLQDMERIHTSLKKKFNKIETAKKRWYVYREELEPVLTEEERAFIGVYWKGGGKKPPFMRRQTIDKLLVRKFMSTIPEDWKKCDMGNNIPAIKYIR